MILEITTAAAAAAVDLLLGSGSTASCRCSAALAGDRDAYTYLPESVRTLPGPQALAGDDGRAPGSSEIRWLLLAGGIIAIHTGDAGRR